MTPTLPKLILSLIILPLLSVVSPAELEQKLLSINAENKQVTLTLFHFNKSVKKSSILPIVGTLGDTINRVSGNAGITISKKSGISIKDSQISFGPRAIYLVKNGGSISKKGSDTFTKHTFVLSNGKGSFILGYAPLSSQEELSYAIQQYVKSNKFNYHTAVLTDSGNSCAFYMDNGEYHPYYLKELNPARKFLMVK